MHVRFRPIAVKFKLALVSTLLCACVPAGAPAVVASKEAWFYSTTTLRPSAAPVLWCSFITQADAKAAEDSDRLEPVESGWMRYRGDTIESLMVFSQSEDSYVEDSYMFGPDMVVKEVKRRGHYVSDPFASATFKPDESGKLTMTAESRHALQSWDHATYFLGWPLYGRLSEIPFAELIDMKSGIAVAKDCRQTKG